MTSRLPSHRAAVGAHVAAGDQRAIWLTDDDLAAAEVTPVVPLHDPQRMAARGERLRGHAGLDEDAGLLDAEAGLIQHGLGIALVVDQPNRDLEVALGL